MNKQRILILDKEQIAQKLKRMAYQIWEYNSEETEINLVGIANGGLVVATRLAAYLKEISPLTVNIIPLTINKKQPLTETITIKQNINNASVILVDDVANSGKTLLYALRPLLIQEPKNIKVAVLVDRKHKAFPVSADIVGHKVATTLQENIEVETEGSEVMAAYLQ